MRGAARGGRERHSDVKQRIKKNKEGTHWVGIKRRHIWHDPIADPENTFMKNVCLKFVI